MQARGAMVVWREDDGELNVRLLERPQPSYEQPTAEHYTLEATVFWRTDVLDTVDAGRRRRLVVGSLSPFRRTDLRVDLPRPWTRFVLARIEGSKARVTLPEGSKVGVRTADGRIVRDPPVEPDVPRRGSSTYVLEMGDRLAFRFGELTFVLQYVIDHGPPRRRHDWLLPAFLERYLFAHRRR